MKKLLLYNFLAAIFLILVSEIALRYFSSINLLGADKNLFNYNNDILVHNQNVAGVVFGKKVFIDKFGFRVPFENYKYKDNPTKSILILGDSTSFGVGAEEEKSFIGLLRQENEDVNIFNTSVIGHNNSDHLNLLNKYYNDLKFDEIIIFYCLNDIVNISGVQTIESLNKKAYLLAKINFLLRDKSYLYIFLKSMFTNPQKRYYDYTIPLYNDQNSLDFLKNTFIKIKQFSDKEKLKISVIILPYSYQVKDKNCTEDKILPQNKIKKILNFTNISYLDLTNEFCNYNRPNKLFLSFDPMHLSILGHQLVFQQIRNFF